MDNNIKYKFAQYPNKIFIETGSGYGIGIKEALKVGVFEKIYSIEKNRQLYEYCSNIFAPDLNVEIIYGSSIDILPGLLSFINNECTFWLDAHKSKEEPVPLLDELKIIASHRVKTHTLLIDDMRLVGKKDYWKKLSIEEIEAEVLKINPQYQITYEYGVEPNDILIAHV